jgi:hypothetical protein
VIKPITDRDEYDVDLVCFLNDLPQKATSQAQLKQMVGDRIKQNETYKSILDKEGRRCWTLNYANEFHLDILPSITDEQLRSSGGLHSDAILITDKNMIESEASEWPKSNPRGYIKWFKSRQSQIFQVLKSSIAEAQKVTIDEIPDYRIKTPLQIAIQILKRHRDEYFAKSNDKPISIIITTLAASLYRGQGEIYNAIYDILQGIDVNMVKQSDRYYIPNPTNNCENFADKWNEDPLLPKAFFEWLDAAKGTFCSRVLMKSESNDIRKILTESLRVNLCDDVEAKPRMSIASAPTYIKPGNTSERKPWSMDEKY